MKIHPKELTTVSLMYRQQHKHSWMRDEAKECHKKLFSLQANRLIERIDYNLIGK